MLAWFRFQVKIPSCSGICVQGEWQKYISPSTPLSKGEGLRDMGYSIRNLILVVNSTTVSYLFHYVSVVLRFHICFIMTVYYKMWQMLLQNVTAILLQNAIEVYHKMCQLFYYKLQQLSQNTRFIKNCDSTSYLDY